jgi:subtilisin family serine protease
MFSRPDRIRLGVRQVWLAAALLLAITVVWADEEDPIRRELTVTLASSGSIEAVVGRYGGTVVDSIPYYRLYLLRYPTESEAQAALSAMNGASPPDPDIEHAEEHERLLDPEGVGQTFPILDRSITSQDFRQQPASVQIGLAAGHAEHRGHAVRVALLDNGIAIDHPEIRPRVLTTSGWDFVSGDSSVLPAPDGIDNDLDGSIDEALQHGTHVAGLISLAAPDAWLIPIRVMDEDGRATSFAIANGILWAVEQGADVINISLSSVDSNGAVERAIADADARGVLVVVPTGNRGNGEVEFPCSLASPICVAAIDASGTKPSWSNYGARVDLSAPGVPISLFGSNDYARWGGTSFATPLVAGIAALIVERYPGLTPSELRALLRDTTQPDSDPSHAGLLGTGIVSASGAVVAIRDDRTSLRLHQTATGTVVRFSPSTVDPRYDLVVGELRQLTATATTIDLGVVTCLANDVPAEPVVDPSAPLAAGEARYYLHRPGTAPYGSSSDLLDRWPSVGGCAD